MTPASASGPAASVTVRRYPGRSFGPDYSVTVWSDGRVEFVGRAWTVVTGEVTARIPPERARALLDAVEAAGFRALAERQARDGTELVFDAPGTWVTLERDGRAWEFDGGPGADGSLGADGVRALAAAVEREAGVAAWVGTPEEVAALVAAHRAARRAAD